MDIAVIANVLLDLFELEAFVGVALLAIVIVTLLRSLVADQDRHRPHPHRRIYR